MWSYIDSGGAFVLICEARVRKIAKVRDRKGSRGPNVDPFPPLFHFGSSFEESVWYSFVYSYFVHPERMPRI